MCFIASGKNLICYICAFNLYSIRSHGLNSMLHMIGVVHTDRQLTAAVDAFYCVLILLSRNRRIDQQAL